MQKKFQPIRHVIDYKEIQRRVSHEIQSIYNEIPNTVKNYNYMSTYEKSKENEYRYITFMDDTALYQLTDIQRKNNICIDNINYKILFSIDINDIGTTNDINAVTALVQTDDSKLYIIKTNDRYMNEYTRYFYSYEVYPYNTPEDVFTYNLSNPTKLISTELVTLILDVHSLYKNLIINYSYGDFLTNDESVSELNHEVMNKHLIVLLRCLKDYHDN